jgi:RecB family exonuclease
VIPHVSASQITTFRDCARKWYLQKIVKLPSPSTAATQLGGEVHAELENWLRDGTPFSEGLAGDVAKSGAHLVPLDRPIEIELSLDKSLPIADSPVRVLGFIDALYPAHARILDHKTSSNKKYTKTPRELAHNVQLMLYGKALIDHTQHERVHLTHVYYGTRGAAWSKRVDVTVTRDHIEHQWAAIRASIDAMLIVSEAPHAGAVVPTYTSCDKYGGCPYAGECFRADKYRPHQEADNEDNEDNEDEMTPAQRLKELGLAEPKAHRNDAQETKPQKATPRARILYIGCTPIKGASNAPINAVEAYSEINARLCAELKVPHLGLADYGRGWAAFSGAVTAAGWPEGVGALYLDPLCQEYERVVSPLSALADVVIRRL